MSLISDRRPQSLTFSGRPQSLISDRRPKSLTFSVYDGDDVLFAVWTFRSLSEYEAAKKKLRNVRFDQ
jgi:hypothetical protein